MDDSYPSLEWGGRHLQPPRVLAEALLRDDGREGGVLAATSPVQEQAVIVLAARIGLDTRPWNNGTGR